MIYKLCYVFYGTEIWNRKYFLFLIYGYKKVFVRNLQTHFNKQDATDYFWSA